MDAGAWIGTLVIVGVLLLLAETVLPGLVAGIAGFACLVAAVVMSYNAYGAEMGTRVLAGVLVLLILLTIAWFQFFPRSRMAKMFVSRGVVGDIGTTKPELLNQMGQTITKLRPSGTALIAGKRVDVITEGSMIDAEVKVKVVAVEGLRVVVRAV